MKKSNGIVYLKHMAKTTYPLLSEYAQGTIGKGVTFGNDVTGSWARANFFKKKTTTPEQLARQTLFKDVLNYARFMIEEERFLWHVSAINFKEYGKNYADRIGRMWRCQLSSQILSTGQFIWNNSPFPPNFPHFYEEAILPQYEAIKQDVETLTGLLFCSPCPIFIFPTLGTVETPGHPGFGTKTAGLANARGSGIALLKAEYEDDSPERLRFVIGHELTHAIIGQHGQLKYHTTAVSEAIANECGDRIMSSDLTPVYTYNGHTLSELVTSVAC